MTWTLVAVLVAVHVGTAFAQWHAGYADGWEALFFQRDVRFRIAVGSQYRPLVMQGEVWRLVTTLFLHVDAGHLALNAVALRSLGQALEPWIGGRRLLGVFLLAGLAGAVGTQVVGIRQSDGASGGVYGLLGATWWIAWQNRARLSEEDRRLFGPILGGFVVLNLVLSAALPFVNVVAHSVGLGAGVILGVRWSGVPGGR